MPTILANALEIGYDVLGAGPPLVMLHGAATSGSETFDRQVPALSAGFRVHLPDARGHGRTRWDVADGFRASWGKACAKVGIKGVTFNDLRGTAVTRLALQEATEAEIATITGHSLRDVRSILDAHYLSRDTALAESAIHKLEIGYAKGPDKAKTRTDSSK